MSKTAFREIIKNNLRILNQVTAELIRGVEEKDLLRRYAGEFVVPGVSIRQHLAELHAGRCLYQKDNKVFLRDECNPVKLLGIARSNRVREPVA